MKTVHEILNYLWTVAPEEGKEPWDNVGHLVGRRNAEVDHILVSLDITMPVIQEAAEKGAQLIVSHHPLIWDTYKHVTDSVFQQDKVLTLAEHKSPRFLCIPIWMRRRTEWTIHWWRRWD